jgi:TolB protein
MWRAAAIVLAAAALAGCSGGGPSGNSLGANAQIFLLDLDGHPPQRVTDDGHDYTAPVWSPRGDRIAASFGSGIALLAGDGRRLRDFRVANVNSDTAPAWSHDGRRLAFETIYDNRRTGSTDARLVTLAVGTGARRTLADFATDTPTWSPRDRALVYLTGDIAIDTKPVKQEVWTVGARGASRRRLAGDAADDFSPQFSRDGRRLLFGRSHSVWTARADGSHQTRVAGSIELPGAASWAPNDRDVLVVAVREGRDRVFVASPSGRQRPLPDMVAADPVAWSPDGRLIAWADGQSGRTLIHAVRPDGSGHRILARLADRVEVNGLSWSQDSRHLAFSAFKSNED